MIDRRFVDALRIIVNRLENKSINWVLAGSVNLALRGVDLSPRDIDIVTDRDGALKIGELLEEYQIAKIEVAESNKIRSHLGRFCLEGVEVEVICDIQTKTERGKWTRPFKPKQKVVIDLEDVQIPASPLEVELKAYENLGRSERVQKIREALKRRNRN